MSAYKDRIAAGLCGKCGELNSNGRSLCDGCREKERQRAAAKRKRNQAAGKCLNCGKPVGTRSKTKCDACLDQQLVSQKKTREVRKASGICQSCGQCEAMPGKTVCKQCSKRMTDVRMKHYKADKQAGLCAMCGAEPVPGFTQCEKCRTQSNERKRQVKLEVCNAYGGAICAGCGCVEFDILEIDHIDGGGNKHRREIGNGDLAAGSGTNLYRWLKRNGYPPGFRVLCPTCNKKAHRGIPLPTESK